MRRLWPCKEIDFSWMDALFALFRCFAFPAKRRAQIDNFAKPSQIVTCISVRSAFDLYLSARAFEEGGECLFIGLNVPDMFHLAGHHGLQIVGVDIDVLNANVDLNVLESAITDRTCCIVVAHYFGARRKIEAISEIAKRYDLDLIEDCAQCFDGSGWSGYSQATLSLFSFGPLKTASALQGGIAVVRDHVLRNNMAKTQSAYPPQSPLRYARRVIRFMLLKCFSSPVVYRFLVDTLRGIGLDHERIVHYFSRSGSRAKKLLQSMRTQPCDALIEVLNMRLRKSQVHCQQRLFTGRILEKALGEQVPLVHRDATNNAYWAIVVLTEESAKLKHYLRKAGFDALTPRLVAPQPGAMLGARTLADSVMLAFSPTMPIVELERLGELVTGFFEMAVPAAEQKLLEDSVES